MFSGQIRCLKTEEVQLAHQLESESYPEDEAASFESLLYRQTNAGDLFRGYFEDGRLHGFVCSTRYPGPHFKHESMKKHIPSAECVCIHSVCVDPKRRLQGLGSKLLTEYVEHVRCTQTGVEKIMLLTKKSLIHFYERAGFVHVGESGVDHGKDTWHQMEQKL